MSSQEYACSQHKGWVGVLEYTHHKKHNELSMRARVHTKRERKSKDNWESKIMSYNEGMAS